MQRWQCVPRCAAFAGPSTPVAHAAVLLRWRSRALASCGVPLRRVAAITERLVSQEDPQQITPTQGFNIKSVQHEG